MPEEFVTRVTSIYDQKSITLYDALQRLREGNNIKKTDENQISIAKFVLNPDYPKKLEEEFWRLKRTLDPPKDLSLPYSDNKARKQVLVTLEKLLDFSGCNFAQLRICVSNLDVISQPFARPATMPGMNPTRPIPIGISWPICCVTTYALCAA
jgi:hypothetical protein